MIGQRFTVEAMQPGETLGNEVNGLLGKNLKQFHGTSIRISILTLGQCF